VTDVGRTLNLLLACLDLPIY